MKDPKGLQDRKLPEYSIDCGSITPLQSKMARMGLGLSQPQLAKIAKVGPRTLQRFEEGKNIEPEKRFAIEKSLRKLGAEFVEKQQIGKPDAVGVLVKK